MNDEIETARHIFADAIHQIEIEQRDIHAFASAALLAAADLYSEVHGSNEMRKALASGAWMLREAAKVLALDEEAVLRR